MAPVDKHGAYPATTPITGGDLTATIFHLLGIDPHGFFPDKQNRPHPLTKGEPIAALLGNSSAAKSLQPAGGDLKSYRRWTPDCCSTRTSRAICRRSPWNHPAAQERVAGLALCRGKLGRCRWSSRMASPNSDSRDTPPHQQVVEPGIRALLSQEIREHARRTVQAHRSSTGHCGVGGGIAKMFLTHFRCRLVLYRFRNLRKDPRIRGTGVRRVSAGIGWSRESCSSVLGSTTPGANFSIGSGLGVLIVVEKSTPNELILPLGEPNFTGLRVDAVI